MKKNDKILLNSVIYWDLNTQPHAAITGKTGSGKSKFISYLILESAKLTTQIYILDGKGGELTNLTAVHISQTTEEVTTTFQHLVEEMHYRISAIKTANIGNVTASEIGFPHIFCFVDELAAIMLNAHKTDRKNKVLNKDNNKDKTWTKLKDDFANEIIDCLTELILVSRQSSLHLILATQHFDSKLLDDSTVRSNISLKVLLGQQTAQEYNMMNLTQDQLPAVDFSTIGSGIIMLDGLGWVNARPYETPYITFKNCTENDILLDRINKLNEKRAHSSTK